MDAEVSHIAFSTAVVLSLSTFPAALRAAAQTTDTLRQTLDLIVETANRICNVVPASGQASPTDVQGNVRLQLEGLSRKLADAGLSGTAKLTSEQYQVVIREQLAATFGNNAQCKVEVFRSLSNAQLSSPAPSRTFSVTREPAGEAVDTARRNSAMILYQF